MKCFEIYFLWDIYGMKLKLAILCFCAFVHSMDKEVENKKLQSSDNIEDQLKKEEFLRKLGLGQKRKADPVSPNPAKKKKKTPSPPAVPINPAAIKSPRAISIDPVYLRVNQPIDILFDWRHFASNVEILKILGDTEFNTNLVRLSYNDEKKVLVVCDYYNFTSFDPADINCTTFNLTEGQIREKSDKFYYNNIELKPESIIDNSLEQSYGVKYYNINEEVVKELKLKKLNDAMSYQLTNQFGYKLDVVKPFAMGRVAVYERTIMLMNNKTQKKYFDLITKVIFISDVQFYEYFNGAFTPVCVDLKGVFKKGGETKPDTYNEKDLERYIP